MNAGKAAERRALIDDSPTDPDIFDELLLLGGNHESRFSLYGIGRVQMEGGFGYNVMYDEQLLRRYINK